jgi:hypothetical protein
MVRPGRLAILLTKRRLRRWFRFFAKSFFISSLCFWCSQSSANARTQSSKLNAFSPQAPAQIKLPQSAAPRSSGFVQRVFTAHHYTYLSSDSRNFREDAATTMPSFDLRIVSEASQSGAGAIDIETRFNANEETFYFRPMELYTQINLAKSKKLFLGRKKMPWSRSDQLWKRGLVEPRHMDDPLEAKRAGLLGAFFAQQSGDTRFFAFASPLFVPEFGPRQSVADGRFFSKNPWFRPPPSQVQLQNGLADVEYQLDAPDVLSIVTRPGGGVGFRQTVGPSAFLESSYLYKPMNQLVLGFPFVLELGNEGETTSVDVVVSPRVGYHHIANLTIGKQFSDGSLIYSEVIFERPEDNLPPQTWIAKQNAAATVVNLTLEKSFATVTNPNRKAWLSFSNVNGGDVGDSGNFSGETSLFERRYMFQQSVMTGWQGRWFQIGKVVVSNMSRALYDISQRGYLLSSEFNLRFSRSLSGLLKFDTLGNFALDGQITDGFLSNYRANDRASLGVRYVF